MNNNKILFGYKQFLLVFLGPIVLFVIWQIFCWLNILNPALLPTPFNALKMCFIFLTSSSIYPDIFASLFRMLAGYFLAAILGVLIGICIGIIKSFYHALSGIVDFFRSIPVTTLYPIFVLFFGIGSMSKIAMVFWASFFVITLNSAYGTIQALKTRSQMARLYGATKYQIFRWITFFDALPQTMIGLRVALSYALIVEILCEMFMGSEYGIGQRVTDSYTRYSINELFALIIIAGSLGYLLNKIFVFIENKVIPWVAK
jgi:NitT/TauT family transport system permease protein